MKVSRRVYLLLLIIEECAEIIHRTCKAIRFGLEERWKPEDGNNREMLEDEIGDLQTILSLNYAAGNITQTNPSKAQSDRKTERVNKFLKYSTEACLTVTPDEGENPANCYQLWDEGMRTLLAGTKLDRKDLLPGMRVLCHRCQAVLTVKSTYDLGLDDHEAARGPDNALCSAAGQPEFELFEKFVAPKLQKKA